MVNIQMLLMPNNERPQSFWGSKLCATCFTYDNVNRLSTAAATPGPGSTANYTINDQYDAYGNMSCTSSTNGAPCPQPTYNAYNRVAGYSYDAAGDVTNDGAHTYTWDGEGRLSSVGNGYTGTFTYNANGWVVEQTGSAGGGYTEDTLRDPTGQVLAVRDGTSYFNNIWANGRIIAQYNQGSSPETYFHHLNNIGSTGVLTNHTGAVTEDLLYYPWGQVWASQGSVQDMHFAAFEGVYPTSA